MHIASWDTPLQNVERSIVGCKGDHHRKKEISLLSFQMDHCPLKHFFFSLKPSKGIGADRLSTALFFLLLFGFL